MNDSNFREALLTAKPKKSFFNIPSFLTLKKISSVQTAAEHGFEERNLTVGSNMSAAGAGSGSRDGDFASGWFPCPLGIRI